MGTEYKETGLSEEEVQKRIREGKVNIVNKKSTKSVKQIISGYLFTFFNFINLILAICLASVQSFKNMLFLGVVISNTAIGIVQELRAKHTIDRLSLLAVSKVNVIRNGIKKQIAIKEIVMDDLMILQSGNQICADSEIIEGSCNVDESMLTGESDPIEKKVGDVVLSGSFVINGSVKTKVLHVGMENYSNKIVMQAKKFKKHRSHMMSAIQGIIKVVSVIIVPLGLFMFYKQSEVLGQGFADSVTATVGSVIGMIPEGLVLLSSVVLAVSVIRLGRENTLIQELFCIETLARVDVLCLDKTGTITEGTMEVEKVKNLSDEKCNRWKFSFGDALKHFTISMKDSNPTLEAIKSYLKDISVIVPDEKWKEAKVVSFSSEKKWSMVVYEKMGSFIMGAPEFVLEKKVFEKYKQEILQYAEKGYRALVFAYSPIMALKDSLPEQIQPLQLYFLKDKLRNNVRETLSYFKEQGVALKVISGDNPITVSKIAMRAGIDHAEDYIDVSALDSAKDMEEAAKKYTVFGRVTPRQKLELVKALQKQRHIVAMTGDGINDVLAFKEADCSIAMQSGSDMARKTAQVVLMNSDFSSLPKVVAEGRRCINNIERSASLFLTKTVYATILAFIFVFLNARYPLVPIQLTLISAVTIGIPSYLLALEPNKERVKGNFLKNVLRTALPGGLLVVTALMIVEWISFYYHFNQEQTSTMATIAIAIGAMINLIKVCQPLSGRRLAMILTLCGIFIGAVFFMPGLFGMISITKRMFITLLGIAAACIVIYWIYEKIIEAIANIFLKNKI